EERHALVIQADVIAKRAQRHMAGHDLLPGEQLPAPPLARLVNRQAIHSSIRELVVVTHEHRETVECRSRRAECLRHPVDELEHRRIEVELEVGLGCRWKIGKWILRHGAHAKWKVLDRPAPGIHPMSRSSPAIRTSIGRLSSERKTSMRELLSRIRARCSQTSRARSDVAAPSARMRRARTYGMSQASQRAR